MSRIETLSETKARISFYSKNATSSESIRPCLCQVLTRPTTGSQEHSLVYNREAYRDDQMFITIPPLFSPDADTTLIFLSGNGIQFFERTNDPWYRATVPGNSFRSPSTDNDNFITYRPDEAASPMGCTEQFQFCNPSLPSRSRCEPLASINDAQIQSAPLFGMTTADFFENTSPPSGTMISCYQWLVMIINHMTPSTATLVTWLGPISLSSTKYLNYGVMGLLPDN